MDFFQAYAERTWRKRYPDGEIDIRQSATRCEYVVTLRFSQRDLALSRVDRDRAAHMLESKLCPPMPRARRHWSLQRSR